jgi:hypothetical protein
MVAEEWQSSKVPIDQHPELLMDYALTVNDYRAKIGHSVLCCGLSVHN